MYFLTSATAGGGKKVGKKIKGATIKKSPLILEVNLVF